MGTPFGIYRISIGVGNTGMFGNITGGRTYYFAITAVDNDGNKTHYNTEGSKPIF